MNKKQSQSGSIHLIITIVLAVALIGALGFVFYQNYMQPKTDSENAVSTNQGSVQSKTDDGTAGTLDDNGTTIATEQTDPTVASAVVVSELVTSYLGYINSTHTASFSSSLLTDAFQLVVDNPSGKMVYKDPILLVQDTPSGFTVGNATVSGDSASVPVTLNFSEPYNIIYSLIIVNNEWKIDSVVEA